MITNSTENIESIYLSKNWIMVFSLFIFAYEIFSTAWLGDDSLFTIRTILNLLNGYGPVFNVGERVQAYTHPLWFFLLSFLFSISLTALSCLSASFGDNPKCSNIISE